MIVISFSFFSNSQTLLKPNSAEDLAKAGCVSGGIFVAVGVVLALGEVEGFDNGVGVVFA